MTQLATLHIDKQAHKFSAAHFTIFSETERERLHGHNYGVSARIVAEMGSNGFSADYNVYKRCLQKICDAHDEYMLLHTVKSTSSLACLKKMLEYIKSLQQTEQNYSFTITWSRKGQSNKHTSYFVASTEVEAEQKFLHEKNMDDYDYKIVQNPIS